MLRSLGPCVSVESRGADMSIFCLSSMQPCRLPACMVEETGSTGFRLAAPPIILANQVCASTLVYEPSDPTRLSDYFHSQSGLRSASLVA